MRIAILTHKHWPLAEREEKLLKRYFKILFKCDNIRFTAPLNKRIFLIIGSKRNTKKDSGVWIDQNGNPQNWDYLRETTIASGETIGELINNAKTYKSLEGKKAIDLIL